VAGTDARLRLRNQAHELVRLRVHRGIQRLELFFQRGTGGKKSRLAALGELALLVHLAHGFLNLDQLLVDAVILVEEKIDLEVLEFVPKAQIGARGRALLFQRSEPVPEFL